ncbi:lysophospholipase, putative [Plasmodium vinckei vinckei]|uniref:Lysophospholipase, putative n=1 Tax=Plasmodium vinckei vinckei TaxID=54757 RepID=A0A449BS29_PLAVN|nr:lysophospholipase, putative [Plasmodium vinckei vinckei]VEV56212.1 lysophospholipase, putative [Plasmodium vinckei vinckei]
MMEEIELNNDELRNKTCNLDGDPKVGWLCNKNGLLLKTYGWIVKNAIGIILLIHGYKGHARLNFMKINLKMPNKNEGLVVDNNNYYIYKDSWIEKFNQSGYSVYALDLQGHGESQSLGNIRSDINCFDDLVDDVIQYMNKIQDEIASENQTDDESYDIVPAKKKRLPMYIMGYSMGGNIALRILQLLGKAKENNINSGDSNNCKKFNTILDNSTNISEIDNDMNNYNDYDSDNSCASTSAMTNAITSASDKHEGYYNYLDKLNIKGCVSLSGMMIIKTLLNEKINSFKYVYLPMIDFMSNLAPHALIPIFRYKISKYSFNIYKHDKFLNTNGISFKCMSELIKATITLYSDINYIPKDIPLLFVHSKDDTVCYYKGTVLFHDKANVDIKKLYIVGGMNHEITVDPGNEEILNKIIEWISNLRNNGEDEIEDK